jgi:Arc/MetJ family transcription regulator
MKTTIDIADALMAEVKAAAAQDGRTVRSLVEEGLRRLLAERAVAPPTRTLRDATFTGNGMNPEFVIAPWDAFAKLIYEPPRVDADLR